MTSSELGTLVAGHSAGVGVELTSEQLARVCSYIELTRKWNERINLIGTQDMRTLVVHHVVDSLAVVPSVPAEAVRMVDVGSGAGLPGALVALLRSDVSVTALEPIRKKHAFLAAVRRELALHNLHPLAQRMEQHPRDAAFEAYDVAVSRATFALPEWLDRACGLVVAGGLILGMEGLEQHELPAGAIRRPYRLGDRTRAIIEWHV